MKLLKPILELNISFDANKIYDEIHSEWKCHFIPEFAKYGNDALLLVTTNGEDNHRHDAPMLPTQALNEMPYTKSIWEILNIPFARSRFMKIAAGGEMPKHFDTHPYWKDKTRLHIPIKTNKDVIFSCGNLSMNMKKGKCYALDNSLLHGVVNNGDEERIHLVIDAPLELVNDYS